MLKSFKNHQTELEFIEAYESIKAVAYTAIGSRPEYYLSLAQQNLVYGESESIIAKKMANEINTIEEGSHKL